MKRQDNLWVSDDLERMINTFCLADDEDIDEEEQEEEKETENTNPSTDSNRPSLKVNLFPKEKKLF